MKAKSHIMTAGVTLASIVAFTSFDTSIPMSGLYFFPSFLKLDILGMVLLGSTLPDIDSDNSVISSFICNTRKEISTYKRRILGFLLVAVTFTSLLYPALLFAGLFLVRKLYAAKNKFVQEYQHRALPHSIWGMLGFSGVIYMIELQTNRALFIPFVISYGLHLLFDSFSMQGIPLLGIGRHFKMPSMLCYKSSSFQDKYMISKKEAILVYTYIILFLIPLVPKIWRIIEKI